MRSTPTLYRRVFLPFAITVVVAMLIAWWSAVTLLGNTLQGRLHAQLQQATSVLAAGSLPFTADLLAQLGALQNADFALLHADGSVGLATYTTLERSRVEDLIRAAWMDGSDRHGPDYDLVLARLAEGRSRDYVAVAGLASLDDIEDATRRTAALLGLLTLMGVAVVAWWGHRLSIAIAQPVRELGELARHVAAGERRVQLPEPRTRELAELTRAFNDMTGRLDAYEAELVRASRLAGLGEIATTIAHEIRNPLTAIKLQLQLLGEQLPASEQQTVVQLLTEIQRLELIVSGTLAHARPQQIETARRDLNATIRDVVTLMSPQFAHRRIVLDLKLSALPELALDADRFKQVLFNVLSNAADALNGPGTVRVSSHLDGTTAVVAIEDDGPGVTPEQAHRLFHEPVASHKSTGLGLGLMVSRELIELHGGSIAVDRSPALGGARFTIRLPAPPGA
ncbi:MAG: HAMP domain-containing sensor histidine kinase [Pseudomonadales bacterium]